MAVQRQRHQEMHEHPPALMALLNRRPWIIRMSIASLVLGEIAFGATATALVTSAVFATLYFWRWISPRSR